MTGSPEKPTPTNQWPEIEIRRVSGLADLAEEFVDSLKRAWRAQKAMNRRLGEEMREIKGLRVPEPQDLKKSSQL